VQIEGHNVARVDNDSDANRAAESPRTGAGKTTVAAPAHQRQSTAKTPRHQRTGRITSSSEAKQASQRAHQAPRIISAATQRA